MGMPDGNEICFNVLPTSMECMFSPSPLLSIENFTLDNMIKLCLDSCPAGTRNKIIENVYLSGGNTRAAGFAKKLESTSTFSLNISAQNREFCAWKGGSKFSMMKEYFEHMSIDAKTFNEVGFESQGFVGVTPKFF